MTRLLCGWLAGTIFTVQTDDHAWVQPFMCPYSSWKVKWSLLAARSFSSSSRSLKVSTLSRCLISVTLYRETGFLWRLFDISLDHKFQVVQLPTTSERKSDTGLTTRLSLTHIQDWKRGIALDDMMSDTICSVWLCSIRFCLLSHMRQVQTWRLSCLLGSICSVWLLPLV